MSSGALVVGGGLAGCVDLSSGERASLQPRPSRATDLLHGFATVANFFQGGKELTARIDERTAVLESVERRLSDYKAARHELEKEVAQLETRLSRFKEQLMAVKKKLPHIAHPLLDVD